MKTVIKKISFYTVEETGTVTCIIKASVVSNSSQNFINIRKKDLIVYGTSRCHSEDNFDEEIGKRISEARAKHRLYIRSREIESGYLKKLRILEKELFNEISNLTEYSNSELDRCEFKKE